MIRRSRPADPRALTIPRPGRETRRTSPLQHRPEPVGRTKILTRSPRQTNVASIGSGLCVSLGYGGEGS
jgi:hypothetical protein